MCLFIVSIDYKGDYLRIIFYFLTMDNISEINDRIMVLVQRFADGNKSRFSKAIGLSSSAVLENIVGKRRSSPSFEVVQKMLLSFDNVSAEWLILGQGELMKSQENIDIRSIREYMELEKELELTKARLHDKEELIKAYKTLLKLNGSDSIKK